MNNPIQKNDLVHTPDSMEDFIAIIDRLNSEEKVIAYTYSDGLELGL